MKQPISFFAIGLMTACFVFLIVNFFIEDETKKEVMSLEEMTTSITDQGYRVISEDEYIKLTVTPQKKDETEEKEADKQEEDAKKDEEIDKYKNEEKDEKEDKKKDEKKEDVKKEDVKKEDDKKAEVIKYKLVVESGMLTTDIAKELEEKKIIASASKFNAFLEKEGYAKYIQLGEFELTSEMDNKELATTITKNRKP